jgi:hypothetical protein
MASSALVGSSELVRNNTRLVPSAAPPTMKATFAIVACVLALSAWLTAFELQPYGRSVHPPSAVDQFEDASRG